MPGGHGDQTYFLAKTVCAAVCTIYILYITTKTMEDIFGVIVVVVVGGGRRNTEKTIILFIRVYII